MDNLTQNLISFLFLAIPSLIFLSWFYWSNEHARGIDTQNHGYIFYICSHIINFPLPSDISHNILLVEITVFHCFHRKLHFWLKMLVSHPWSRRMLFYSEHTYLFTHECGFFLNIDEVFYIRSMNMFWATMKAPNATELSTLQIIIGCCILLFRRYIEVKHFQLTKIVTDLHKNDQLH